MQTTFENPDLVTMILQRLPLTEIACLAATCKQWHSLVSDSETFHRLREAAGWAQPMLLVLNAKEADDDSDSDDEDEDNDKSDDESDDEEEEEEDEGGMVSSVTMVDPATGKSKATYTCSGNSCKWQG